MGKNTNKYICFFFCFFNIANPSRNTFTAIFIALCQPISALVVYFIINKVSFHRIRCPKHIYYWNNHLHLLHVWCN